MAPIKECRQELRLDWHTIKELEKSYMRAQLDRAGTGCPHVIGIHEVSIRKRHVYGIVGQRLAAGAADLVGVTAAPRRA